MRELELWQLWQRQSLPREVKLELTFLRIRQLINYANSIGKEACVSFSAGIQSTFLKWCAEQIQPDIVSEYCNTGIEHPLNIKFARTQKNVVWLRPELKQDEVITLYGYPGPSKDISRFIWDLKRPPEVNPNTRNLVLTGYTSTGKWCPSKKCPEEWLYLQDAPFDISPQCCEHLKKKPCHKFENKNGLIPMIGEIAAESRSREKRYLKYGCNAFECKRPISRPLGPWIQSEILSCIKEYKIPYSEAYGDIVENEFGEFTTSGEKRTGCTLCPMGCHMEKGENRFQRMKRMYPKMYEHCINGGEFNSKGLWVPNREGLGMGFVLDYYKMQYKEYIPEEKKEQNSQIELPEYKKKTKKKNKKIFNHILKAKQEEFKNNLVTLDTIELKDCEQIGI